MGCVLAKDGCDCDNCMRKRNRTCCVLFRLVRAEMRCPSYRRGCECCDCLEHKNACGYSLMRCLCGVRDRVAPEVSPEGSATRARVSPVATLPVATLQCMIVVHLTTVALNADKHARAYTQVSRIHETLQGITRRYSAYYSQQYRIAEIKIEDVTCAAYTGGCSTPVLQPRTSVL
jgi:hypothetical protein